MSKPQCIIYTRVSSDKQVDGTSLDTQEETCRAYAEREGYVVAKVFREEGVSAKMWRRPEFMKALEYLKANQGKVSHFIMYKVDRISRKLEDQFTIMQSLREAGATLLSATENIDDTPAGRLQRNILWAFAEYDNDVRAERSRNGSVARFKEGYWINLAPAGYAKHYDDNIKRYTLVPDENAKHIKQAFNRRSQGWEFARIADELNTSGYQSKKGNPINANQLERILKKKIYMGTMECYGIEVEGKHEPLISQELWDKVQKVNEQHAQKRDASFKPVFPLRGIAFCHHCKQKLTASAPMGRSKRYEYYHHMAVRVVQ